MIFLFENYSNPFNTLTNIKYLIAKAGHVELKVCNFSGQLINTLVDRQEKAGSHVVEWDGRDDEGKQVSSGIYFYCLKAGAYKGIKKRVVSR